MLIRLYLVESVHFRSYFSIEIKQRDWMRNEWVLFNPNLCLQHISAKQKRVFNTKPHHTATFPKQLNSCTSLQKKQNNFCQEQSQRSDFCSSIERILVRCYLEVLQEPLRNTVRGVTAMPLTRTKSFIHAFAFKAAADVIFIKTNITRKRNPPLLCSLIHAITHCWNGRQEQFTFLGSKILQSSAITPTTHCGCRATVQS